jgi:uncharacterized protein (UPF0248 family)
LWGVRPLCPLRLVGKIAVRHIAAMIPIQELLSRICWDKEFAQGEFVIGYYDRIKNEIISVPLKAAHFTEGDRFAFQVFDEEGEVYTVPFHRIREVRKDGELIWQRRS